MTLIGVRLASSKTYYQPAWDAYAAIDGVVSGDSGWISSNGDMPTWWQVQFLSAQTVTSYAITRNDVNVSRNIKDFTFEGSNDGTVWTILDTRAGITWPTAGQTQTFTVSNTTAYLYYRFYITANNGDAYTTIMEISFGGLVAPTPTPYAASVLADSPWGFWEQTETSGTTLLDSSGSSRRMAISGASATLHQPGSFADAPAIAWANSAGYAYTSVTVSTSVATVEAWIYLSATPAAATQILGGSAGFGFGTHDKDLYIDAAGKVVFFCYTGAFSYVTSPSALSLNTWHHVVASVGAAGMKLRIDKTTVATNTPTTSDTPGYVMLLRGGGGGALDLTGNAAMQIAAPAFYTTQLSDARTDAHYDTGMAAPTTATGSATTTHTWATTASGARASIGAAVAAVMFTTLAAGPGVSNGGAATASAVWTTLAEGTTTRLGIATVAYTFTPATSGMPVMTGWTADLSQRSRLEILSSTGELDYTPPAVLGTGPELLPPVGALALPPVGLVERVLMRHSVSVPAMAPGADHQVHINDAVYATYPAVDAVLGVPHVIIGGVDVTYLRGAPIGLGTDRQEGPFGDVTAVVDLHQITPQDTPGVGSLAFLKQGATFERILKNGSAVTRVWAGHLVSDDGGNDESAPRTAWTAHGTMWQASTYGHRVPTIMDPTDIGTVITKALNGVVARRYPAIGAPVTGIKSQARGSSGDSELAYCQSLLARAWTPAGTQWTVAKRANTARTYDMKLKDRTTVHHTVTVGAFGVTENLSRDMTSTVNAIFGRGIAPNGYAWAGWCYPNFMADTAPAYPYSYAGAVMSVGDTDAGTTSGTGVSDWQRRVNDLNLTGNVPLDGVYNASDAAVCRAIQAAYGLLVDGVVGPQTWDATFDVGGNGGDLSGAYRRPLAIDPATEPNLYTPTGAVKGPNPAYTGAMRYERDIDYGPGVTKIEATQSAVLEVARDKTPGLTGTATLTTDPREGSRMLITPGQNIRALGYNGGNPLLHIAAVDRDWDNLTVALEVDEQARDAITLAGIRDRNKEAMLDPARRPGRTNRRSRQDQDQVVPFDGESDGGIIPRHAIYARLWTVIRIPLSEAGVAAKLDVRSQSPAAPFCMAFFAGPITPAHLVALVGDPLSGTNPFGRTEAKADALDDLGLIEAFGGPGSAAGYSPGQQGSSVLTGKLKDTGGFTYNSTKGGWVWVAEWSPTSCFISGRVYPAVVQ